MNKLILNELNESKQIIEKVIKILKESIHKACVMSVETIKRGNKIIFFGNGGSAADAQHFAAELVGRF